MKIKKIKSVSVNPKKYGLASMRKTVLGGMMLLSVFSSGQVAAGPWFAVCETACVIACVGGATWMFPPGVVGTVPLCAQWCAYGCAFSCFGTDTTLIVLEDGKEIEKNIVDIRSGDMVRTIRDGKLIWTKVLKNTKTEGEFEFVQIDARNITNGNQHQLRVTPAHGMVLIGEDGRLTLDAADNMVIDDKIIISDNDILSVTEVDRVSMQDRYTLETADGTVLASGVLVSTICGEEIFGGEKDFDSKMEDWKEKHSALIDDNEWNQQYP